MSAAGRIAPVHDRPEVVALGGQPVQPEDLVRASELRLRLLGQAQEVGRVAAGEVVPLLGSELRLGVLTQGFEQPESHLVAALLGRHE